jgi:class 3 adenylate cyclase
MRSLPRSFDNRPGTKNQRIARLGRSRTTSRHRGGGSVRRPEPASRHRLDFTVIGPAVNEVARIEALCEPLARRVLVSSDLANAVGEICCLEPRGRCVLRGVCDAQEIYGLQFS